MKQTFCDRITRRDAIQIGSLSLLGLGLPELLRLGHGADRDAATARRTADAVIFVNLAGGPSHLDTLDMKPEAPLETRGEFTSIATRIPGLHICEHMPNLAAAANQFALVRGISHSAGSHPLGQSYISTGNRPGPAVIYPSLGSVVSKELPGDGELPPYIAIPQTEWNAGFLGDAHAPFKTNAIPKPGDRFSVRGITVPAGISASKLQRREKLLQELDRFQRRVESSQLLEALDTFGEQAYKMITSKKTKLAFDVSLEAESIRKTFKNNDLGQSLLLATRLVEFGVPFVTVTNSGWDTHLDNFSGHRRLIPPLDAAIPALLSALESKGLLERTLVVVMGEFGRTPKINANRGRDHYPRASWAILAGAGVRGGLLLGGTNKDGTAPDDDTDVKPDDICATILNALGIDHHSEYLTATGRPISLIPFGRVLDQVY